MKFLDAEEGIRLESREGKSEGTLLIQLTNLPLEVKNGIKDDKEFSLKVEAVKSGETVTISDFKPRFVGSSSAGSNWVSTFVVTGLEPGIKIARYLSVSLVKNDSAKPPVAGPFFAKFSIEIPEKNKSKTPPEWTVNAPPKEWHPDKNDHVGFSISVKGEAIKDLKVVQSTLQSPGPNGAVIHANDLQLSLAPDGVPSNESITLPANSVTPVYLKLLNGGDFVGEFEGEVRFAVGDGTPAKHVRLKLAKRAKCAVFYGVLWMFLGIALALGVNWGIGIRRARLSALIPVERLREVLDEQRLDLLAVEEATEIVLKEEFGTELKGVIKALSDSVLDGNYLLPNYDLPPTAKPDGLKDYLTVQSDRIKIFEAVLEKGLKPMAREWSEIEERKQAEELLKQAASLSDGTKNSEVVDAELVVIWREFKKLLGPRPQGVGSRGAPGDPGAPRGVESIRVELAALGFALIGIWAVITLVVGWAIWIDSNAGFGLSIDYVKCFFWGLGLPVIGKQMETLTPGKVGKSLDIPVPIPKANGRASVPGKL